MVHLGSAACPISVFSHEQLSFLQIRHEERREPEYKWRPWNVLSVLNVEERDRRVRTSAFRDDMFMSATQVYVTKIRFQFPRMMEHR